MRPRRRIYQQYRYSYRIPSSRLPGEFAQFGRPPFTGQFSWEKKGIPTAELNGFALGCIEKLAFPGQGGTNNPASVEDTIATVMIEKLPSYTTLKATLEATGAGNCAWSDPLRYNLEQLRNQTGEMRETITAHLVVTGEEIGLPAALMAKLADLTRDILERYAA